MSDWAVIHRDVYPAYLDWETYLANQARLADNANRYLQRTRGAVRSGSALLVGLVVCGRQMHVEDKPHPHYVCSAQEKEYGVPLCRYLDGPSIDEAAVATFFSALQPAELALLEEALATARAERQRWAQHYAEQVRRADYDVRLAQRQYQAVDPDNRLVAAEVERRWEVALRTLADARESERQFHATAPVEPLDAALRAQLTDLSQHLPTLWASGQIPVDQKKALLRSRIRRIVVDRLRPDVVEARVIWVSGAMTRVVVRPPVYQAHDWAEYDHLMARIRMLSEQGYHDGAIAQQLTSEGVRSPRQPMVPTSMVTRLRRQLGLISLTAQFHQQEKIAGCWTIRGLALRFQVDRNWLYERIRAGRLPAQRHPVFGYYLIADDPAVLAHVATLVATRR